MERIAHWLSASGVSWTSSEAVPTGSERELESGIDRSSSTMVAVLPDLRDFNISAVQRLASENKRMASSEQLSQATLIYEQVFPVRAAVAAAGCDSRFCDSLSAHAAVLWWRVRVLVPSGAHDDCVRRGRCARACPCCPVGCRYAVTVLAARLDANHPRRHAVQEAKGAAD